MTEILYCKQKKRFIGTASVTSRLGAYNRKENVTDALASRPENFLSVSNPNLVSNLPVQGLQTTTGVPVTFSMQNKKYYAPRSGSNYAPSSGSSSRSDPGIGRSLGGCQERGSRGWNERSSHPEDGGACSVL